MLFIQYVKMYHKIDNMTYVHYIIRGVFIQNRFQNALLDFTF